MKYAEPIVTQFLVGLHRQQVEYLDAVTENMSKRLGRRVTRAEVVRHALRVLQTMYGDNSPLLAEELEAEYRRR